MPKYVLFAASLIVVVVAGTSIASGQSATTEECREMSKALSSMPPALDVTEKGIAKLDVAMKGKILPRVSGELKASTVSALEAQKGFLSALEKYHVSMNALIKQLQLCADANPAAGATVSDAPAISMSPRDDLKSGMPSVPQSPSTPATDRYAAPNRDLKVTGNPAHDRVSNLPKPEQAALLGKAVPCTGTGAFFMGMGPASEALWSVRCTDGRSYAVSLATKVADSKVIECSVLAAMGAGPCFKKVSGQ